MDREVWSMAAKFNVPSPDPAMSEHKLNAVLFDKDGTLLDYFATWLPINRKVALFAARGEPALADELLRLGGQNPTTNTLAPNSLLAAAGIAEIVEVFASHLGARTPAQFYDNVARIFRDGGAETAVMIDGAREVVVALKSRGFKVGLATNDTADGLHASLAQFDILQSFDFVCGCDSGYGVKPDAGMGLAFARAIGLSPSRIAIVGDSTHDLELGHAAGFGLKVAVLSGTGTRDDLAPHADVILSSVNDLLTHASFRSPSPIGTH
jgi:phosphoglycolate phosphatase